MVLSEDSEDHLFKKHQELCSKLNLDVTTVNESWERFQNMATNFSLEGEPLHWLGCAVFVTCKKTSTPTVGRSLIESSCVNITSLLRHCNFSLTQFFNKISRWAEMANMSDDFRSIVKRLEGSFAVSYNIFKKYTPIFNEIFKGPIETETCKQPRNRKQRTPPCTPTKLFEFCWILFITAKGKNPEYSEDIVTSFHLLVACCDLIFKNAFLDNRKDLLNAHFPELPTDWLDSNFVAPSEAPCIVNYLCEKHNGTPTDAKYVKEYSWKELIDEMFTRNLLQGLKETFTDLLEPGNFEVNLRNLTKMYESQLLSRGDFDERIFMAEYRRRLLLKEQAGTTNGNLSFTSNYFSGDCLLTSSPRADNPNPARRLATTKSVSRLQTLLSGRHSGPSTALIQIFQSCSSDPTNKIKQLVDGIGEKVKVEFGKQISFDHVHQLAVTLFYKFVENIFQKEKTLHNDISPLTDKVMFYECTLACCFEIVIYSYGCQKKYPFPWILNCLGLQPFYFVRVIELIVRSTDQLPREAVKHLNMVEQKVFEYLIWKSDSLLWEALKNSNEEFPKFEDTALPGNLIYNEEQAATGNAAPRTPNALLQSPGPSAIDRFQSPIVNTCTLVEVKKQLFKTQNSTKHILFIDQNGKNQFLPIMEKSVENVTVKTEGPRAELPPPLPVNSGRPKKTGSLYIILRKFYNLAYSRMEQLCNQLEISDMKFRQKIWTVFEHSIREHTDLMRDRNLDQLLMCAVYVVCKVTGARERKFAEIMEHYRSQPQASSHIYRNVLISREDNEGEQRGDLISFYNTVYVQAMKSFALQFSFSTSQNCNITLSPLPLLVNNNLVSPRCHVSNNLYITPYNTPTNSFGKGKTLDYHFSRSPCRDLKKINTALNGKIVGKRLLSDDSNPDLPPNKRLATKMQSIIEQRRSLATE